MSTNLAISAVATAPSPASSGTSLTLTTGHGTRFPTSGRITIWPTASNPDPSNAEICTFTRSGDVLTIVRAQESTSARSVVVGDQVACGITAAMWDDIAVMTTQGDMIVRGASAGQRLAIGVSGSRFVSNGTDPSWSYPGNDAFFEDDFFPGQPTSGATQPFPFWYKETIVAGGSLQARNPSFSHPGVLRMNTGTTAGNGYCTHASDSGTPGFGMLTGSLAGSTNWDMTIIFMLGPVELNTTSHSMRIGIAAAAAVANEPANWFGLRYDTALSDTNFMFCTRASSAYGLQGSTGVAADNAWHRLRIRSIAAGTLRFSIDGGSETTTSSSVMTSSIVYPFFQIVNNATSTARSLDIDYFSWYQWGIAR